MSILSSEVLNLIISKNWPKVERVERVQDDKTLSSDGEGFASHLTRVEVEVVEFSQERNKLYLVVKYLPGDEQYDWVREAGHFIREIKVFTLLMPHMEELMQAHDMNAEFLWPSAYYHVPYDLIVLEDLKGSGYRLFDKEGVLGYDLDHSQLVLEHLAIYHILTAAVVQKKQVDIKEFERYNLTCNPTTAEEYVIPAIQVLSQIILEFWDPQWKDIGEKLKALAPEIPDMMKKQSELDETKFNVVNHGDLWRCNMVFQYNEFQVPISIKFLDFQLSHYNSYAYDLVFVMNTVLSREVRKEHFMELIELYHFALGRAAAKYGVESGLPERVEDVLADMGRLDVFGLVCAVTSSSLTLGGIEEAREVWAELALPNSLSNPQPTSDSDLRLHQAQDLTLKLQDVLSELSAKGVL